MNMSEFTHEPLRRDRALPIYMPWLEVWWELGDADELIVPEILPNEGLITFKADKPIVLSFLYDVRDVDVCIHAFLGSDPSITNSLRHAACQAHITAVIKHGEALGYKYQIWQTDDATFERRLERDHGFIGGGACYYASEGAPRLSALEP